MATVVLQSNSSLQYMFDPQQPLARPGKFSTVCKGSCVEDKRDVVIKILNYKNSPEADLKFSHPAFIPVTDVIDWNGKKVLVRPYVDGKDLIGIARTGYFRKESKRYLLKNIIFEILDALEFIHVLGYIHGDVRPHNILLVHEGSEIEKPEVRVLDLGLARKPATLTEGHIPFSLIYSSPEQMLQMHDIINQTSDLYSLAVTIYELLSGKVPFLYTNPEMLMHLMINQELPEHPFIPADLLAVLRKATARHRFLRPPKFYPKDEVKEMLKSAVEKRYQDGAEFREALQAAWK